MSLLCLWQSFHRILRYFLFFVIFSLRNCQLANIADHLCVEIGLLQIDQNRQNDIGGMSQKSNKSNKRKEICVSIKKPSQNRKVARQVRYNVHTDSFEASGKSLRAKERSGSTQISTLFYRNGTSIFFFYEIPLLMSQGMLSQRLANNMQ